MMIANNSGEYFNEDKIEDAPEDNNNNNNNNNNNKLDGISIDYEYISYLYKRRWLIIATYASICMLNAFSLSQYDHISIVMSFLNNKEFTNLNLKNTIISWLSELNLACYIPFVIPAMLLVELKGLKSNLLLGTILAIVSSCVKLVSIHMDSLIVLFIAQFICATSQTFVITCLLKLCANWFGANEVATAVSIGVISAKVGYLLASTIPTHLFSLRDPIDEIRSKFYTLYVMQTILACLVFLLTIFGKLSRLFFFYFIALLFFLIMTKF
jgi:hypothetical protein